MGPGLDLVVGKGAWTRESGRLTGRDWRWRYRFWLDGEVGCVSGLVHGVYVCVRVCVCVYKCACIRHVGKDIVYSL